MTTALATGPSYGLLATERELAERCQALVSEGKPFGFDIETGYEGESREEAQLHPEENLIAGLSLTNSLHWARYIPVQHDSGTNVDPEFAARTLWPLLATGLGVPHGGQFELRTMSKWFMRHCPDLAGPTSGYFPIRSDTMLELHAEGKHPTLALKPATLATFGHQMTEIMELFDTGKKLTKFEQNSIRFNSLDQHDPKVCDYACEDSLWTLAHHYKRYMGAGGYPSIADARHPQNKIYRMEMSILPIVCAMEDFGLQYDWSFMRDGAQRGRAFQERLSTEISTELSELLGEPIKLNIASPKQVAEVLYTKLGLPVKRRSRKTNNPSTDKIALKGLSKSHPVVQKIVNWKQLAKLCGTYLETYEKKFSYAEDGLTHPHHMQCGVPAGRFAVNGPPYQQSPKKYHYTLDPRHLHAETLTDTLAVVRPGQFSFNFRDAIVCPPGYYGLGFDYSQIELRVIAGEADERALIAAFAAGTDVHSLTASLMLSIPLEQVSHDEHRPIGKTMNFALMYQMGVDGLADRLGITKGEAQALFEQYFAAYPAIKGWIDRTVAAAIRGGYVTTRFGRRVPIWEFDSAERWKRREGERLAGNAPIQGGAADYMKLAMIRQDRALERTGLKAEGVRLVMNIHDALEYYVPRAIPPARVMRALTRAGVIDAHPAILFPVPGWPPVEAEWHIWRRWGTTKDIELGADGKVHVVGAQDEEVLIPGDEDEEGPALPAVDLDAMRRARAEHDSAVDRPETGLAGSAAAHPRVDRGVLDPYTGPRRTLVIVAPRPSEAAFEALCALVKSTPGPNDLILRMPPDDEVRFGVTCGLAPEHEPDIELALGSARVHWDAASVDPAVVGQGLSL